MCVCILLPSADVWQILHSCYILEKLLFSFKTKPFQRILPSYFYHSLKEFYLFFQKWCFYKIEVIGSRAEINPNLSIKRETMAHHTQKG